MAADGTVSRHTLAVATITITDGIVQNAECVPFQREEAGVTYHDLPLRIEIGRPLQLP